MRTVRGCIRAADDTAAEHVTVGVRPQIGLTPRGTHSRGGLDLARDPRAYLAHGERRLVQGLQVDPGPHPSDTESHPSNGSRRDGSALGISDLVEMIEALENRRTAA